MSGKVIILGAKGRFGRAAVEAFSAANWQVRALARSWEGETGALDVQRIAGDAFDATLLADAAIGCDVIVNALNPPYPQWARDLPRLTASVVKAAKISGATLMIPGNVYNYGAGMPKRLTEETAHAPTARKGHLREEMEAAYIRAGEDGVQTIILRAGDFIEREKTGNWFDSHITADVAKGRVMYPAPLNRLHAWAYLPDLARVMVGLAEKRKNFAAFEQFGFPGYGLTGQALVDALERILGSTLKVKGLPWPIIRLLGVVMPQMREIYEMKYLWHTPHLIDGSKLTNALPEFHVTPLEVALADALNVRLDDKDTRVDVSLLTSNPLLN